GFVIGTLMWFVKPLVAYNKAIDALRDENDLEETKWLIFLQERKKLELARLKSLPMRASDAQSAYGFYLEKSIERSGLTVNAIVPSAPVKVKPAANSPQGVKDVGHLTMTFTLTARGELSQLIKLMEILQTTPYEHRVRSLNVDRIDMATTKSAGKRLVINMVIETLLVAGNHNRASHPPGVNTQCLAYDFVANRAEFAPVGWGVIGNIVALRLSTPTPEDRRYSRIADKNVFVGSIPIEKYPKSPTRAKEKAPATKSPGDIPAYIKLVQTVPSQKEAYLINLFYRNEEYKLSTNPKTGYQVRRISDDYGAYVFFFMKVHRIDSGLVFFQVEDEIYTIELGQTLAAALEEPLTTEELEEYGLKVDTAFAKQQMKKR
ncbi:MAG TPA: hypothetical protein VFE62_22330, partial [Gemmataceae bacterium]|nr:hypothetical protein [Gemmataceae bacterium]